MGRWVNESHDGAWVTDTMGQVSHRSPKVTHGKAGGTDQAGQAIAWPLFGLPVHLYGAAMNT